MSKFNQTKYITDYIKEKYKRVEIRIKKEDYEKLAKKIEGKTVPDFIREKIEEVLKD